jgi:uncharacterized phage-like protein YoqJ
MIIGTTGHRPLKVGGFITPNPTYNYICQEATKILLEHKPEKCISGMAVGWDQYFVEICIALKIPFIAAVPFKGQESHWPKQSQTKYHKLLEQAERIVYVNPEGYAAWKMQTRNEWIVDNCDLLLAIYNNDPFGGTYNCVKYAEKQKRDIIRINPLNAPVK